MPQFPGIIDFIEEVKQRNLAKTSRYWVSIPVPNFMRSPAAADADLVSLFCLSATLPELILATSHVQVDGTSREVVVNKGYGKMPLVFACDENMVIKRFFDSWIGGVVNSRGGILAYPDDYTVDGLTIHQLNTKHEATYSVELIRAYPVSMGPVYLHSDAKGYNQLQVYFVYKFWIPAATEISTQLIEIDSGVVPGVQTLQNLGGGAFQIQYVNDASPPPIDTGNE